MKDRRYKNVEDLIEDYQQLLDEQTEIPLSMSRLEEKYNASLLDNSGDTMKTGEAQYGYKILRQIKRFGDRVQKLQSEINEIERYFKGLLISIAGKQLSFEKKEDSKTKVTYLFWVQDGQLQSKRSYVIKNYQYASLSSRKQN